MFFLLYCTDYHLFMHCTCNFICGLSDVIIKTFSQSVSISNQAFAHTDFMPLLGHSAQMWSTATDVAHL